MQFTETLTRVLQVEYPAVHRVGDVQSLAAGLNHLQAGKKEKKTVCTTKKENRTKEKKITLVNVTSSPLPSGSFLCFRMMRRFNFSGEGRN